jgi:hypothetical protein
MSDLEAYRRQVEQWSGKEKSVSKNRAQTRFHRLNNAIILQMLDEQPEFKKRLVVDESISKSSRGRKYAETHLIGKFSCKCKKKKGDEDEPQGRDWPSGKVYTEIFVDQGASECKFDVVVWNQRCVSCRAKVSSDIDEATYRERVFSKLLLLLGLRAAIARDQERDEKITKPHIESMCCGCKAGKCLVGRENRREYY